MEFIIVDPGKGIATLPDLVVSNERMLKRLKKDYNSCFSGRLVSIRHNIKEDYSIYYNSKAAKDPKNLAFKIHDTGKVIFGKAHIVFTSNISELFEKFEDVRFLNKFMNIVSFFDREQSDILRSYKPSKSRRSVPVL